MNAVNFSVTKSFIENEGEKIINISKVSFDIFLFCGFLYQMQTIGILKERLI